MQKFDKMPFNDVCVETCEKLLARMKEGRINCFAFSVTEGPLYGDNGFVGELGSFYAAHYGLIHCARRMSDRLDQSTAHQMLDAPANLYCYDVSCEPVSHDFIAWLVNIKMMQAREGNTEQTKVCFVRSPAEDFVDTDYRASFFKSVMVPALELFGCVQDPEAKAGRRVTNYTYSKIVEACRSGELVPRINVPPALRKAMGKNLQGIEPVTITLREHDLWTHRNSSVTDWLKFAEYLRGRGEHVILVRDYAKADEDVVAFETMPAASKDFAVRAALYEISRCNFFVSNGPSTLGHFGYAPWLQFVQCDENEEYLQNRPEWWLHSHGIRKGEQFPWSGPRQRIIWKPDTYENMVEAWEEHFAAE